MPGWGCLAPCQVAWVPVSCLSCEAFVPWSPCLSQGERRKEERKKWWWPDPQVWSQELPTSTESHFSSPHWPRCSWGQCRCTDLYKLEGAQQHESSRCPVPPGVCLSRRVAGFVLYCPDPGNIEASLLLLQFCLLSIFQSGKTEAWICKIPACPGLDFCARLSTAQLSGLEVCQGFPLGQFSRLAVAPLPHLFFFAFLSCQKS